MPSRDQGDALVPGGDIHGRRGAGQDQGLDPLGRLGPGHGDHAAQRNAAEAGLGDARRVHHRQHVVGQQVEAVVAGRGVRGAVAAGVDPQQAEGGRQQRDAAS
jgi:hypothetical protein